MKIGVSTGCLYPMLTEDGIRTLCELGFDRFEIFFNTFSELENDYLDQLKSILHRFHAKVTSIHPFTSSYESFLLFSAYERRFIDGVRLYEKYYRTAHYLGADKVVLHGLRKDFSYSMKNDEYFRRFDILQKCAGDYGVTLLQENVNQFVANDQVFIRQMKEAIPDSSAFVCDTKQSNLGGIRPADMVRTMGSRLRHIHISDFTFENKCVLPGKGIFDFEDFFSVVKETGFDGDVIIEVYRFSFDKIGELKQAYDFLKPFCEW